MYYLRFVEGGVELPLHQQVVLVGGPSHKVVNGALRAVAVVHLETISQRLGVQLYATERNKTELWV